MASYNRHALAEAERRIAEVKRTRETALNLSDLGLEVLPENVCRLAHLRSLYLNDNRLAQLPDSIARLAQLQSLSLLDNRLTQLPRCVGHLARLETLCLTRNQLTQLPKSIGKLARLKRLHLDSNQLVRLPESIGGLVQLEELYLHRNQLTQLPESIRQLARLRKLYLHGNEALDIPAKEQMRDGSQKPPHEILDYYFRTRITGKSERGGDRTPGNAVTEPLKLGGERIKINRTKICFVIAYFGKWPIWFPAFLHSCKKNPTINWAFFTDCGSPPHHSSNVVFYNKTLAQMRELIERKLGTEATLEDAYKVPDYKPAFGMLFDDYLNDFDFWGHCDIDIIWGDIRKYATDEILNKHDVFSTRKGRISGHFSLFRNTPGINQLFRQSSEFPQVMRQVECNAFDEEGMTHLIARLAQTGSIRVYWPKFLHNYANPKTDTPSTLPRYINKYFWDNGRLFDCTGDSAVEIPYLHFMTWKKTLASCEFSYGADPEKFYISYFKISIQPISTAGSS
jgi:Leucine rich repeat